MVSSDHLGSDIKLNLKLSNLIRGKEAENLAIKMNRYNKWEEDEEPIFFTVKLDLIKYEPEDDDAYFVSDWDFQMFDSSYSQIKTESYLSIDNEFGGKIYEGGSLTGLIGVIIPKGDQSYIVFEENVWFKLQ